MNTGQHPKILNLSGSLGIDRASTLYSEIASALEGGDSVLLNLSQVEELDLPCLQVIFAAKAQADAQDKEFHLVGSVPARIAGRLASCGFARGAFEDAGELESALIGFWGGGNR